MVVEGRPLAAATADLMHAVLELTAELDLTSLLGRFVDVTTSLTGARYGAINILDERGTSTTFVQSGFSEAVVAFLDHPPRAVGVLGQIPDRGVLRLDDLTRHPAFGGLPTGHPSMGSFLGVAVRVRAEVFGYLYLADKRGGFDDEDEDVVLALGAAAGVAIQNAQLVAAADRRERWLAAGQDITTMLLEGADEEDVLTRVAWSAREVDGADTCVLVLPGMGDELVMEIVDGRGGGELLGLTMARTGHAWESFLTGSGVVVPSLATAREPQLAPLRQFGPALYAPLRTGGRSVGVLMLLRCVGANPFTPADLAMSQTFAAQAALALELADARRTEDAAALRDERARIARDLHDMAIQQLFATGMQLETVRQRAERDVDVELTGVLGQALESVDSSVQQIRVIVHELHDPDDAASLVDRLARECSLARIGLGFTPTLVITSDGAEVRRTGVAGSVEADTAQGFAERLDDVIGADRADDVVAVTREGLANAARHAHSSAVTVRVVVDGSGPEGSVQIEVEDDGDGVSQARVRHSGTKNLAARAQQEGGTFTLGPPPSGRGTLLSWRAPLG